MIGVTTKGKAYLSGFGILVLLMGLAISITLAVMDAETPRPTRPTHPVARWSGDVDARKTWVSTGVNLEEGEELRISAWGMVVWASDVKPPDAMVGPNGAPWGPSQIPPTPDTPEYRFPDPSSKCGSLVAKIGDRVFGIGSGGSTVGEGPISFMVNSRFGWLYKNSGAFHVELAVYPPVPPPPPPRNAAGWLWLCLVGFFITVLGRVLPAEVSTDQNEPKPLPVRTTGAGIAIMPKEWNLDQVTTQLRSMRYDTNKVHHFVDSIVTNFIAKQDYRVAKTRIELLKAKLEELGLMKEFQASLDELEFREANLEIKRLKTETEKLELENKKADIEDQRARKRRLAKLEHHRDTVKVNLEIAALEKQMQELKNPPQHRSPEEIKKEARARINGELRKLDESDEGIDQSSGMRDTEKMRRKNINSQRREELLDELEEYR